MIDNAEIITIVPNRPGAGGSKTAIPSFLGMAEIRDAKNIVIKNGRWENILTGVIIKPDTCPAPVSGRPDLAGPVLYPYIYHTNTNPVTTTSEIWSAGFIGAAAFNMVGRLTRNGVDSAVIILLNEFGGTVSFETIKEKLFITNGVDAPFIYDGPATLESGTTTTYTWGIREGPPITSITYDTNFIELTDTFNVTSGNPVISLAAGTAIPASGYQGKTIWLQGTEQTNPGNIFTITGFTAGGPGTGALTVTPTPTFTTPGGSPCASQINFGNITWTQGAPSFACSYYDSVRAHSGSIGDIFTPSEFAKYNVNLIINTTGDTTGFNARCDQVLLWSTPAFSNGGNLQTLQYQSNFSGALSFYDNRVDDTGLGVYLGNFLAPLNNGMPLYFSSIASWNGCCWGLAPRGPASVANASIKTAGSGYTTITLTVDPPPAGGTQAVLIGTLLSGALWAVHVTNPGSGYATVPNVTVTGDGSGAQVTVSLTANFDLSLLMYSNSDDPSVLGRGEESWDPRNFLRIPAKDGAGLGLSVVGDSLIIQTERFMYTVGGDSPASYRLVKLSSKGLGVGQYHLTEYVGDATDSSSAMVFLGQDRVVWGQTPGSGSFNMSAPVQNIIDGVLRGPDLSLNYTFCRLSYVSIGGESYLIVMLK